MERQLGNITIHYEVHGEGKPILLLHGAFLDHRHMMSDLEPVFVARRGWQRIYLDLPGHGQTPAPEWLNSQGQVLQVISALIDQLLPDQRFVVAGTSWGGYFAQALVYQQGNRIDGAFLNVCSPIRAFEKRSLPEPTPVVQNHELLTTAATLAPEAAAFLEEQVVQNQRVLDWWVHNAQPAQALVNWDFCEKLFRQPSNNTLPFAVNPLPQPFPAPTLILAGKQDVQVGWRDPWTLMDSYPRATFAALDGAGHFLWIHQPKLFQALVNEWLDRVEEYCV